MRAADLFVRCLEQEGVKTIYGVPGEENVDLMDALLDSDIHFITTHHEQGAAFMAAMEGRLTGKPGVCLSTLGPGATNLLTGVAAANMESSPLVAITGQGSEDRLHKESHQIYDLEALFKPVTKWSDSIRKPEIIPEVIRKAFQMSMSEKPGATYIILPEDIAAAEVTESPLESSPVPQLKTDELAMEHVAETIERSERPIILAGFGIARQHAEDQLRDFAHRLQAPVVHTLMGKGAISSDDPLSFFTVGIQENDHITYGIDHADLVISIGYDMVEYPPARWNPEGKIPVVHIDTEPAEIDSCYPVTAAMHGRIDMNLAGLTTIIGNRSKLDPYYAKRRIEIVEAMDRYKGDSSFPIKPQRLIAELRDALYDKDILISDVGMHKMWLGRMYPTYHTNTCIIANAFASMGGALPGAIAAARLNPHRNVLAVVGDGAFQMSLQEMETAVRLELPIVIVIWNDCRYGLIESKQMKEFGRASHVKFNNPDYVKLAEAYGAEGIRITSAKDLKPTLEHALNRKKPIIIDCPIDFSVSMPLEEILGEVVSPS